MNDFEGSGKKNEKAKSSEGMKARAPQTRTKIVHLIYENRVAYGQRQKRMFMVKLTVLAAMAVSLTYGGMLAYNFVASTAQTVTQKTDLKAWWNQFQAAPTEKSRKQK